MSQPLSDEEIARIATWSLVRDGLLATITADRERLCIVCGATFPAYRSTMTRCPSHRLRMSFAKTPKPAYELPREIRYDPDRP